MHISYLYPDLGTSNGHKRQKSRLEQIHNLGCYKKNPRDRFLRVTPHDLWWWLVTCIFYYYIFSPGPLWISTSLLNRPCWRNYVYLTDMSCSKLIAKKAHRSSNPGLDLSLNPGSNPDSDPGSNPDSNPDSDPGLNPGSIPTRILVWILAWILT